MSLSFSHVSGLLGSVLFGTQCFLEALLSSSQEIAERKKKLLILSEEVDQFVQRALPELNREVRELGVHGLVLDLTEEVSKNDCLYSHAYATAERVKDLKRSSDVSLSIPVQEVKEAENILFALAYRMKNDPVIEGEKRRRIIAINSELKSEDRKLIRDKVISIYKENVFIVEFGEGGNETRSSLFLPKELEKEVFSLDQKFDSAHLFRSLRNSQPLVRVIDEETMSPTEKATLSSIREEFKSKSLLPPPPQPIIQDSLKEERLDKFTEDYTARAEKGLIDPVYGRDEELQKVFDALTGDNLSSVLIYGQTGSGKTKIAEGIALKIVQGNVPSFMEGRRVIFVNTLDLMADTPLRGQLEGKILKLMRYAKVHASRILLVFDEIFQSIERNGDALSIADLLKTHIDRANFPLLAMTTNGEFEKLVEKDPIFSRRFKHQEIKRFTIEQNLGVLALDKERLERKKNIKIDASALEAVTYLSFKFVKNEGLPSAAYKLLDDVFPQAIREGLYEITAEQVVAFIATKHELSPGEVWLELDKLKKDPCIDVIDKSSLLHKYSNRLEHFENGVQRPCEARQIMEALQSPEYSIACVTGVPRVGKTCLIRQVTGEFSGKRVALSPCFHDLGIEFAARPSVMNMFVSELKRKAGNLVLVVEDEDLFSDQFGSTFLKAIRPLIESGKLPVVVEVHDERIIPKFWQERSTFVGVLPLTEITQAKVAKLRPKIAAEKPSPLSLFFHSVKVLAAQTFSVITVFFARFFNL